MSLATEEVVPSGPLTAYLATHLDDGASGPARVRPVGEGRSNLTFTVSRGGPTYVLRRPPRGDLPATAHDMLREFRVLSALAPTPVRAPRPVLLCADPEVIGVPFYLMEVVDGHVIRGALPEEFDEGSRRGIGEELVDALGELHTLDVDAAGLGDLGRPVGYAARQVARWTTQWAVMQTRPLPDVEAVRTWLEEHVPTSTRAALVHGDYKLDNVVFARGLPPRLRTILDWEMATLGDPLADLGYLLVFWPERGQRDIASMSQVSVLPGFSSQAELVARYEARTGTAVTDLTFFRTLALWKLAILSEGLYKRYRAGKAGNDWFAILEGAVPRMASTARAWCGA